MVDRHVGRFYRAIYDVSMRAQREGFLPDDIAPIHSLYILAGSAGLNLHQAEECKRLADVDPFDDAVVEEHARAVE